MFSPTSTMPPVGLLPEETTSFEIGADMRFWNDRITLDLTYYNQTTVNQILNVATSSTTGYRSMRLNAGEIGNSGVELMVNAKLVQNTDRIFMGYDTQLGQEQKYGQHTVRRS